MWRSVGEGLLPAATLCDRGGLSPPQRPVATRGLARSLSSSPCRLLPPLFAFLSFPGASGSYGATGSHLSRLLWAYYVPPLGQILHQPCR